MEEKEYLNKDLYMKSFEEFSKETKNFVGPNFEEQLEWAMLLVQQKFQQVRIGATQKVITRNTYNKSFLLNQETSNVSVFKPFTDLQVGPDIFPNINIKAAYGGD